MNTQAVQVANTPTRSTLSPAAEDIKVKRDSYVSDNAAEERQLQTKQIPFNPKSF